MYDEYLVPLIFESFATDLAERTVALSPISILETAAGSGVVARALAPRLVSKARYVVTDLNQPMLDQAAKRQGIDTRITWRQADALDLPFSDESFDVVLCQFGVMFYPDRIASFAEARRVLKNGGALLFNVWDEITSNEFADVVTRVTRSKVVLGRDLFPGRSRRRSSLRVVATDFGVSILSIVGRVLPRAMHQVMFALEGLADHCSAQRGVSAVPKPTLGWWPELCKYLLGPAVGSPTEV